MFSNCVACELQIKKMSWSLSDNHQTHWIKYPGFLEYPYNVYYTYFDFLSYFNVSLSYNYYFVLF